MSFNDDHPSYYGGNEYATTDKIEVYRVPTLSEIDNTRFSYLQLAIRSIIWALFIGGIAIDALMVSTTPQAAMYWIPLVLMGFFFAWVLDGWIVEERLYSALALAIPYAVLIDYVMSY